MPSPNDLHAQLDARLDRYADEASRSVTRPRVPRRREAYTAAVAAALAASASAEAEIVYSGIQNISIPWNATGIEIDLDGRPGAELHFLEDEIRCTFSTFPSCPPYAVSARYARGVRPDVKVWAFAQPLGYVTGWYADNVIPRRVGANISPDELYPFGPPYYWFSTLWLHVWKDAAILDGFWDYGTSRIMGFRFEIDDGSGPTTHVGWLQFSPYGTSSSIKDWAYESEPDTPIVVGAMPPDPPQVPGAHPALLALAMGAAGVRAFRNARRKTPKAAGQGVDS